MFKKIYIEISDICGLNCSFCPSEKNIRKSMNLDLFKKIIKECKSYTKRVCLHILGDPCLSKNLLEFLEIIKLNDLEVDLVTSGAYLKKDLFMPLNSPPIHQLSISLNAGFDKSNINKIPSNYLQNIFEICHYKISHDTQNFINLRIQDTTLEKLNFLKMMILKEFEADDIIENHRIRLAKKVFLNITKTFEWANLNHATLNSKKFCHGLISQIGILADGRVVPCCIDCLGQINLGNLKNQSLSEILSSTRVENIKNGFKKGIAIETLCKHCKYPAIKEMA